LAATAIIGACAPEDAGGDPDVGATPTQHFVAHAGERCRPDTRVGLIEIYGEPGALFVWASLYGTPDPWASPPSLAAGACAYYPNQPQTPCDETPCPDGEVCGFDGACGVIGRERAPDAELVAFREGQEQVFAPDPTTGYVGGKVTLDVGAVGLRARWLGIEVTLAEAPLPPARLEGLVGAEYTSEPGPIAVTWTPVADTDWASVVTTEIRSDHHARSMAFIGCQIAASAGGLTVDGPLTALLGQALEYYGHVEHVRFAAAETSLGCVEVRASAGSQRPSKPAP
jgi:hypothetical protein